MIRSISTSLFLSLAVCSFAAAGDKVPAPVKIVAPAQPAKIEDAGKLDGLIAAKPKPAAGKLLDNRAMGDGKPPKDQPEPKPKLGAVNLRDNRAMGDGKPPKDQPEPKPKLGAVKLRDNRAKGDDKPPKDQPKPKLDASKAGPQPEPPTIPVPAGGH